MGKGFKKVPFEMRNHLADLTTAELKVWMYYYLKSDRDNESNPSNPEIAKFCDMNVATVKTAKRGLRTKGWLVTVERSRRLEDGTFTRPTEVSTFPWAEKSPTAEVPTVDEKGNDGGFTVGGKTDDGVTDDGKTTQLVDTGFTTGLKSVPSVDVDTERSREKQDRLDSLDRSSLPEEKTKSRQEGMKSELAALEDKMDQGSLSRREEHRLWELRYELCSEGIREEVRAMSQVLSSDLKDRDLDPVDALRVHAALSVESQTYGDLADAAQPLLYKNAVKILKVWNKRHPDRTPLTVSEFRFRLEAPPHDGATLMERTKRVVDGTLRNMKLTESMEPSPDEDDGEHQQITCWGCGSKNGFPNGRCVSCGKHPIEITVSEA